MATALSILPDDARARLVLASDGVDTEGNFGESVARATAAGIPIDVYPIRHQRDAEVRVESVAAPNRVRPGQRSPVRIACSRSSLRRGCFVSSALVLKLIWILRLPVLVCRCNFPRGRSVWETPQNFEGGGTISWRAVFEPASSQSLDRPENNVGTALTFVEGEGRVLCSKQARMVLAHWLKRCVLLVWMSFNNLPKPPVLTCLHSRDSIWWFCPTSRAGRSPMPKMPRCLLAVTELGVGLLTVGGNRSFGAGGWLGSELADVFPLDCQPPPDQGVARWCYCHGDALLRDARRQLLGAAGGGSGDRDASSRATLLAWLNSTGMLSVVMTKMPDAFGFCPCSGWAIAKLRLPRRPR